MLLTVTLGHSFLFQPSQPPRASPCHAAWGLKPRPSRGPSYWPSLCPSPLPGPTAPQTRLACLPHGALALHPHPGRLFPPALGMAHPPPLTVSPSCPDHPCPPSVKLLRLPPVDPCSRPVVPTSSCVSASARARVSALRGAAARAPSSSIGKDEWSGFENPPSCRGGWEIGFSDL